MLNVLVNGGPMEAAGDSTPTPTLQRMDRKIFKTRYKIDEKFALGYFISLIFIKFSIFFNHLSPNLLSY